MRHSGGGGSQIGDGEAYTSTGGRWASFRTDLPLVKLGGGFSVANEQYRKCALMIEEVSATTGRSGYVVAITSPDAGAGKSITSLNLAITAARRGEKKVLVIEADLWKPQYEGMLTMSSAPVGLSDLLVNHRGTPLDRCVVSIWSTGLDVLVAGSTAKDGDLVTSRRMVELVDEARRSYDIVVIDTAPFALASGRALVSMADGAIIVARCRKTRRKGIDDVLKAIGPDKTLGLLLNDVRGFGHSFGDYSAYRAYDSKR